jgi:hypothetical protein
MIRFLAAILFSTLVMQMPVSAQQPATTSATDYVLVTVGVSGSIIFLPCCLDRPAGRRILMALAG